VIGLTVWLSWPDNAVADYVSIWQGQRDMVRGLRARVAAETDLEVKAFFAAWLAQEEGDIAAAIRGFEAIRSRSRPGTSAYLVSTIRLGQAYGLNNETARELAAYQSLLPDHPAASRMSQATFHLRRREVESARDLLREALALDARDGSLGEYRDMAQAMLNSATPSAQAAEGGRR
jgi:hypothetical protein